MSTMATPITTTIISSSTPTGRWKTIRSGSRTTSRWSAVGIDIGSSGTQVIFSRINLRRYGEDLTSRYYVVSRETLFQSPVALTPYASDERIDDAALGGIIDEAYAAAGVKPGDIDTGVVILTGEALRRENAEAIAGLLAEQRGDFVTATAGHHMESMLAAYGSGASKVSYEEGKRILNIDIGGGTTKLAVRRQGRRDRDRRAAYRRPAAGGRRHRPHRAARSGGALSCPRRPASTGRAATCSRPRSSTRWRRAWPICWSRRSRSGRCRTRSSIST